MSVWKISTVQSEHACAFPMVIPSRAIQATTQPGQKILDPYLGSGTTLAASKTLRRHSVGVESQERYCEMAAVRIAAIHQDPPPRVAQK